MTLCLAIAGGPTIGALYLAIGVMALAYAAFAGLCRFLRRRIGHPDDALVIERLPRHHSPK